MELTRIEIYLLQGREIDALVAEKVMGFVDLGPLQSADLRWQKPTVDGVVVLGRLPYYSTNISAAWQVVERMSRIPKTYIEAQHMTNTRFMIEIEKASLWACTAEEAALEICRAALLAVIK